MTTNGIQLLFIETHNWGKAVAFWQALGFKLEFETDHHSGLCGPLTARPCSSPSSRSTTRWAWRCTWRRRMPTTCR